MTEELIMPRLYNNSQESFSSGESYMPKHIRLGNHICLGANDWGVYLYGSHYRLRHRYCIHEQFISFVYVCINIPEKEQKGVGLFMASNRLRELQNRALRSEMEIIAITAAYIKMV